MEESYKMCTRCIMDGSDSEIKLDEKGICNNCRDYEENVKKKVFKGEEGQRRFNEIITKIREDGNDKKYDCVIGVSGGVDSTYVMYLAKKKGLRPLAVHLDNGWDTKTAVKNVGRSIRKLDIDLYTYVIDWEEFKDFQLAYFKASVVDIEAITDHAIKAALYKAAGERGIKYILSGVNFETEGVIPRSWRHNKNDYANIRDIHNKFGKIKEKTFPFLTLKDWIKYRLLKGIKYIEILNYIPYNKEETKSILKKELGWEDYSGKHGESMFTYFYQAYILPKKFNIDKRRAHLSSLIRSGQISREKALEKMKEPLYTSENLKKDKEYVLRKLGFSEEEFEQLMKLPIKSHYDYKSNEKFLKSLRTIYNKIFGST